MDLVWIIYWVDTLTGDGLNASLTMVAFLSGVIGGAATFFKAVGDDECANMPWWIPSFLITTFIFTSLLAIAIPSKDTAYKMLAAYGVSEVYQAASKSEKVNKIAGKSLELLEKTIDGYLEEGKK